MNTAHEASSSPHRFTEAVPSSGQNLPSAQMTSVESSARMAGRSGLTSRQWALSWVWPFSVLFLSKRAEIFWKVRPQKGFLFVLPRNYRKVTPTNSKEERHDIAHTTSCYIQYLMLIYTRYCIHHSMLFMGICTYIYIFQISYCCSL